MEKKTKKASFDLKGIIVAFFLVALVLFYFQHLNNRSSNRKTNSQTDELESLYSYDMIAAYPKTARDVLKMHNRYFKVFYSQKIDDDKLSVLNKKIRFMYSSELLSYNPENMALANLKKSIDDLKDKKTTYKSYELPEASQIIYYERDGKKMATTEVKLTVNVDGDTGYLYVQYVLVKEEDQWKILAWGDSKLGQKSH